MIDWTQFPPALELEHIFSIQDPCKLDHELGNHCFIKEIKYSQALTPAEFVYQALSRIGGEIASDGFVCLFHEVFSPESFAKVCGALTEVGSIKLCELLREAWSIYTKGNESITLDQLRAISVRRFNTRELMGRFDAIGEEIMKELEQQYANGKVWSVEYARFHCAEFEPIREGQN